MQFTTQANPKPHLASFYDDLTFSDKSVVITPLLDSNFGKEIRIAFKQNQEMKAHQTKFPITVMTLKGNIAFSVENEIYTLKEGDVISLEGGVMHSLKAIEESVVRLSLHKGDTVERVKTLLN